MCSTMYYCTINTFDNPPLANNNYLFQYPPRHLSAASMVWSEGQEKAPLRDEHWEMEDSDPKHDTLSRKVGRVEVGNEPAARTCTPAAEWTSIQMTARTDTISLQIKFIIISKLSIYLYLYLMPSYPS